MSRAAQVLAGAAAGSVALGIAGKVVTDRLRTERHLRRGEEMPFGSLRADPFPLTAADGVTLHVEVDESKSARVPTVIFVHGWLLNLDAWHYQRAALRGEARLVFFDQRSHGRSGQAAHTQSSAEDLADDLKLVIDEVAPTGTIILVGHSLGGMAIMAYARKYPDLFGERITGVALCATSAGHLVRAGSALTRLGPILRASSFLLDAGRSLNSYRVVKRYAIGAGSEEKYAVMTYDMIVKSKTRVFLDFYPIFLTLDVYDALDALGRAHTVVIGATKDQLTPFRHSKKLAELIPGAELIALEDRGHMLTLEDHEAVTEAIVNLVDKA